MAKSYTLAQKLRDPNKRKSLPLSALTPAQQKERLRLQTVAKDNANPLYDPAAALTGHQLAVAAARLAGLEIDPKIAALNSQDKMAVTQGTALADRVAGYSSQADTSLADAQAREQALTDRLNTELGQVGQRTQDQLSQAGADASTRLAADATLRGSGLGGGGDAQVQDELAAARARAAGDAGAYGATGATTGANYEGLTGATRAAGVLRGQEYQQQLGNELANQRAQILQQKSGIEATRGDLTTKNLLGLRQSEFTNQATAEGLGLKSAAQQQDQANKAADRKLKMQIAQINSAERQRAAALAHGDRAAALAWQKRRDALQRQLGVGPYRPASTPKQPQPATGPGSRTPEAEQKTVSRILTIKGIFDSGTYTPPGANAKPVKGFAAIKATLAAQNVDPRIIAVAESLYRNKGSIGPAGVRQAHNLGLHVHGHFHIRRPRKLTSVGKVVVPAVRIGG